MNKRRLIFISSIIVFVSVLAFVFSGSDLFSEALIGELPYGTFTTWIGLIAFPLAIFSGCLRLFQPVSKTDKAFSHIFKILIVLALIWGFVGYALAGNWLFKFNETMTSFGAIENSSIFWNYTYALVILPILCWIVFMVFRFKNRSKL